MNKKILSYYYSIYSNYLKHKLFKYLSNVFINSNYKNFLFTNNFFNNTPKYIEAPQKVVKNSILSPRENSVNNFSKRCYSSGNPFRTKKYLLHKLKHGPSRDVELKKKDGLKFYKQMVTIRRMENTAATIYQQQLIRGFLHLYAGQEACCVGMKAAMRKGDDIIGAYRIHGFAYLMGFTVKEILGELMGKASGTQRGKGGSMHMYREHFYGGNGIVGAQLPVGTGIALSNQYKKNGAVCFTLFGDGAINQGQVYESFNMAKLWRLPVIYVVENNGYAMGTAVKRGSALTDLYKRGHYVPGLWVDGMDVLAVREACKYCIEYTLKKGPILMELATYRYYGHSMSDPGKSYRTREEVQGVRAEKDPIMLLKNKILESEFASEEDLKAIDMNAKKEVDESLAALKKEKEAGLEEVTTDISVQNLGPIRGILPWHIIPHTNKGKPLNVK